ncbi:hypothetical protein DP73_06740 [Desulfosporosinus sp. HMP52]|uniref:hypothetical protein n=1 Tax=Desulfosporosinus sp. HMP52 TaxID=1487923 RepID=UPI00051FE181|nr:hypothetical protein [Desulfosporosinus sp. HMP52]KGK90342.1 hypothetical protein DP73_06740 [Desulfosporosinus sp. HMP52]
MSEISKVNNIEQVCELLGSVLGHDGDGVIAIWTKQDKQTKFFAAKQKKAYLSYIASKLGTHDVYYSVCLLQRGLKAGRGKVEDVIALPGVWLDIDITHDAHKASHYPTSVDEAMEILKEFPLAPTVTIFSGYGLHVYWLFKELWMLESSKEREAGSNILQTFKGHCRASSSVML